MPGTPLVLRNAIVRPPGANFAGGLTTAKLGSPDHGRALAQHGAYSDALERCGLTLTRLPEDLAHADSTFVEGTAVLTTDRAILARPGAPSRAGEVPAVRNALSAFYRELRAIAAPGTLDGGLAYLGDRKYVAIEALAGHSALRGRHVIVADAAESYATNCIRVNDRLLVAGGHPRLEATLRSAGYQVIALEMSEFQKMDGGLSCLSLRL